MSIIKTKCFSGLGYINPKGKDRKIKKLERTYIKGKRGVKLYYGSAHYDEYEIDDDYDGDMKKMKLGRFLENQFAERNCETTLSIWKAKKLQ